MHMKAMKIITFPMILFNWRTAVLKLALAFVLGRQLSDAVDELSLGDGHRNVQHTLGHQTLQHK